METAQISFLEVCLAFYSGWKTLKTADPVIAGSLIALPRGSREIPRSLWQLDSSRLLPVTVSRGLWQIIGLRLFLATSHDLPRTSHEVSRSTLRASLWNSTLGIISRDPSTSRELPAKSWSTANTLFLHSRPLKVPFYHRRCIIQDSLSSRLYEYAWNSFWILVID